LDKNSLDLEKLAEKLGGRLCSAAFTPAPRAGLERELGERGIGAGCHPQSTSRIDADGGAAGRPMRKFSVLQSLEDIQNRERISVLREPAPLASGRVAGRRDVAAPSSLDFVACKGCGFALPPCAP
jgi:hypothetical protein